MLAGAWIAISCPTLAVTPAYKDAAAAKQAAFEAIGERRVIALSQSLPARSPLSVYIESDIAGFELQTAKVHVTAGSHGAVRTYSEIDNQALKADGVHRMLRTRVRPGRYDIRLEIRGRRSGSGPEAGLFAGLVETGFTMPAGSHSLVIPVSAFRPANRTWHEVIPYSWPVRRKEPQVRMARYLRHIGQTNAALFELHEMLADGGPGVLDSPRVRAELAFGYIAFGMPDQARAHFDALVDAQPSLPAVVDLRIGLARLYLQEGRAHDALALLEPDAPEEPVRRLLWLELESRALISIGQYQAAAALLESASRVAADVTDPSFANYPLILRFNRAVALLRADGRESGRTVMDELGRLPGDSAAERAIRDRANLALGFHLLGQGAGDAAGEVLRRVPRDSPLAARALAGQGWAAVTTPESRGAPLKQADGARLRHAVAAWTTLVGGDASLPAVQESLVARAYAYHRLGSADRAHDAFSGAIELLLAELERLAGAMTRLHEIRRTQPACTPLALAGIDPSAPFLDERRFRAVQRDRDQLCMLAAFLRAPARTLLEARCPGSAGMLGGQGVSPDLRPSSECGKLADFEGIADSGSDRWGARTHAAARNSQQHMLDMLAVALEAQQALTEDYLLQALAGLSQHDRR